MTTILSFWTRRNCYIVSVASDNAASAAMLPCTQLSFNYLLKLTVPRCPCCTATACCSPVRLPTRDNAKPCEM